jgi:hypothetical protein
MAYAIIKTQSEDIYTSFLALNPFIDFNMMEEGVPLATVENAIQIIVSDYKERKGLVNIDGSSTFDQGADVASKVQYDVMSQNKICVMSDHQSFRSNNVAGHIEGFKKQVEIIKMRQ